MAMVIKKKEGAEAPKKQMVAAVATTEKAHKDGSTQETTETLSTKVFDSTPAMVNVTMGLTRNLGNYESLKITVGLTMPCEPTSQGIDDAFHEAKGWVDSRIEFINQEVQQEIDS